MHLIGKDILQVSRRVLAHHAPSAGSPLPLKLLDPWLVAKDGAKLSKSTGNIADPLAVIEEWKLDAFRYFLVRGKLAIGPDGNWTDEGFRVRYNAELANGLGNLLNRSVSMLNRYRDGDRPAGFN